jgi:hypothetical protein
MVVKKKRPIDYFFLYHFGYSYCLELPIWKQLGQLFMYYRLKSDSGGGLRRNNDQPDEPLFDCPESPFPYSADCLRAVMPRCQFTFCENGRPENTSRAAFGM